VYSEFEFSQTLYNYYIHPQWDEFGSRTLFLKVIMADYDERYAVIELLGEWNDAIENDIMELKREVVDIFMRQGIRKFIFVAENVLNFHSSDREYYEEWYEELADENGWAVILNMPSATRDEFMRAKLHRYLELKDLEDWRVYRPIHLFRKIDQELSQRLGE
jgi:hypothetical protein